MMDYWIEYNDEGADYIVFGGDRHEVARTTNMRDAALVRQSVSLLELMSDRFPGLINGEDDVNGGDLVDFFSQSFAELKTLKSYLACDGEFQKDEEIYDPKTDTSVPVATGVTYPIKDVVEPIPVKVGAPDLARAWLKARNALESEIDTNVRARIKADKAGVRPTLLSESPLAERAAYEAFRDFEMAKGQPKLLFDIKFDGGEATCQCGTKGAMDGFECLNCGLTIKGL